MKNPLRKLRDVVFGGPLNSEEHDEYRYGKTRRVARAAGRALTDRANWLMASPLAAAASVALTAYLTTSEVTPLGFYDFNKDGVEDVIVAFPGKITGKARIGYIDGNFMPSSYAPRNPRGGNAGNSFISNRMFFTSVGKIYVDNGHNAPSGIDGSTAAYVEDFNDDGIKNLEVWSYYNGIGAGFVAGVKDIYGAQESSHWYQ